MASSSPKWSGERLATRRKNAPTRMEPDYGYGFVDFYEVAYAQ